VADGEDFRSLLAGLEGFARRCDVQRERLLDEDVLAGLCRGDDLRGVLRVGGGEDHGIRTGERGIPGREHLSAVLRGELAARGLVEREEAGDGDAIGKRGGGFGELAAPPAGADESAAQHQRAIVEGSQSASAGKSTSSASLAKSASTNGMTPR